MKLDDMFWVKLYEYKKGYHRYDDTFKIMEVVKDRFGVELTFLEALELWSYVSGCQDAGWLCFDDEDEIEALIKPVFDDYLEFE